MGYPPYMAAALSGASLGQLAHWRRETASGPVLVPEVSAVKPVLYSFRDVVALRTFVFLRKDVSLQKIRVAVGNLRSFGELGHLSEYTLDADGASIVLVKHNEAMDLVTRPGQMVMAQMSDVLRPFVNRSDVEVPALLQPRPHITIDPEVRLGHPVIAGTRVPYESVASLIADGVSPSKVREYYPAVGPTAAREALDFAEYVDRWRARERRQVPAV